MKVILYQTIHKKTTSKKIISIFLYGLLGLIIVTFNFYGFEKNNYMSNNVDSNISEISEDKTKLSMTDITLISLSVRDANIVSIIEANPEDIENIECQKTETQSEQAELTPDMQTGVYDDGGSSSEYKEVFLPYNENYFGFKSYMPYQSITNTTSEQWKLQQYAYTGNYGIRMVDGRYCVAVGTFWNMTVGQYFDIVLENGIVIPCIMGEVKDDIHTDSKNVYTIYYGTYCPTEFIIDEKSEAFLNSEYKIKGNVSWANENWNSSVKAIRIYNQYY